MGTIAKAWRRFDAHIETVASEAVNNGAAIFLRALRVIEHDHEERLVAHDARARTVEDLRAEMHVLRRAFQILETSQNKRYHDILVSWSRAAGRLDRLELRQARGLPPRVPHSHPEDEAPPS